MSKKLFLILLLIFFTTVVYSQAKDIRNGTIIEQDDYKLVRKHEQEVIIDYSAQDFQKVVYDDPIKKNKIDNLQEKQKIQITQLIIIDNEETWLKIKYNQNEGYILFSKSYYDLYHSNEWMPVAEIQSGSKIFHTVKCTQGFLVQTHLRIRDKPGLDGTKIGLIEGSHYKDVSVETIEVTEEEETIDEMTDRWAKVEYNGITGWVFGGYLVIERGGYKYHVPELMIYGALSAGI